ncbi:MAG: hypothetical protein HZB45_02550 [Mycolicibacterium rufum]|nr:hypothetical protein [Mycolicibacterium rufum]
MGLGKVAGEYIEEMTEPMGWPDIDETLLRQRANDLLSLRNEVAGVLSKWHSQSAAIFEGGAWSGSAAQAGNASVSQRIREVSPL